MKINCLVKINAIEKDWQDPVNAIEKDWQDPVNAIERVRGRTEIQSRDLGET